MDAQRNSLSGATANATSPSADRPQHLLIDADDTLWENNVYFERAIDEFVALLAHTALSAAEIRAVLDEIELANVGAHGYGAASFGRNLHECYRRLAAQDMPAAHLPLIQACADRITQHPIELMAGVEATLQSLASRHDLVLVTKGQSAEQQRKIDASGLAGYFDRAVIVPEKDAAVYAELVASQGFAAERTWMVGNSPKSDINPALAAGINAVFVPHPQTWRLEHAALSEGPGRLLVISAFAELLTYF